MKERGRFSAILVLLTAILYIILEFVYILNQEGLELRIA